MDNVKAKKKFSYKDLLYKVLIFLGTVSIIVYFLPREGNFKFLFVINKRW